MRRKVLKSSNTSAIAGLTLIELMIVGILVGVLTAIALPMFNRQIQKARLTEMAITIDSFRKAFELYRLVNGQFPDDSHIDLPAGMIGEIPDSVWRAETAIGGNFNWEGLNTYTYAGVSVLGPTAPEQEIMLLDRLIDDGDITTGKARFTRNGRYTFIFEE